ncbi:1749_t:CDS:2 [Diversispora eburnea]|uniref:1749_t:CDS:1 n=1 Tax=Diversispora eburnea TaxID=1213867 RepID=A0A9N8WFV4_9GLOM|nr:1749_t:CDS:2 [Diversispora eburnea]
MFCQIINSFLKSSRVNVNNLSLSIRNSYHLPNLIIRKGFKTKIIVSSKTKNSKHGKNFDEKFDYNKDYKFNIFDDKINVEKNHYNSRNNHSNESKRNSFSKNNDVKNVSYNHDKRGALMQHQNQEDNLYHTRELRPMKSSPHLDNRETNSIDTSSSENVSIRKKSTRTREQISMHSSSRFDNQGTYSNNILSNENVSTRNKLTRTREPISTQSFSYLDDQEIYSDNTSNDDKYSSSIGNVSIYNDKTSQQNRLTSPSRLEDQETYSNNTSDDDKCLLSREKVSIQDDKTRYKNKSNHENNLRENKSKIKESENANESDDKISTEEIIGLPLQKLTRKQRQRIHNKPKDKEKIYNNYIKVNFKLLEDFPKWLRGLKLQKFIPIFSGMHWTKIINLTWEELEAMGVYQYQVKKRLLVSFENIKKAGKERKEN